MWVALEKAQGTQVTWKLRFSKKIARPGTSGSHTIRLLLAVGFWELFPRVFFALQLIKPEVSDVRVALLGTSRISKERTPVRQASIAWM